jgi:hypothetical protein
VVEEPGYLLTAEHTVSARWEAPYFHATDANSVNALQIYSEVLKNSSNFPVFTFDEDQDYLSRCLIMIFP